jgi:hypothetical protein
MSFQTGQCWFSLSAPWRLKDPSGVKFFGAAFTQAFDVFRSANHPPAFPIQSARRRAIPAKSRFSVCLSVDHGINRHQRATLTASASL